MKEWNMLEGQCVLKNLGQFVLKKKLSRLFLSTLIPLNGMYLRKNKFHLYIQRKKSLLCLKKEESQNPFLEIIINSKKRSCKTAFFNIFLGMKIIPRWFRL